jgi:hypothetical protein
MKGIEGKNGGILNQLEPGDPGNEGAGRPPKVLTQIKAGLEAHVGKRVGRAELNELLEIMIGMSREELREYANAPDTPAVLSNYAMAIVTGDAKDFRKMEATDKLLDRSHGKPIQSVELSGKEDKPIQHSYVLPNGVSVTL